MKFVWICLLILMPSMAPAEDSSVHRSTSPIPFETKKLTYNEKAGLVHFEETFKVSRDSQSLEGNTMVYNLSTRMAEAEGDLTFSDPNIILKGNRLSMDTGKETFHWRDGVTGHFADNTWFFRSKKLDGTSESYKARRAQFTSCNALPPHYHIKAWSGRIKPGKQATFYHAFFFMGPIPFFYWPWFTKNLSDKPRPTIYLEPGQNGRDGSFIKSVIAYPLAQDKLYLRAHVDYFSANGFGGGPEILFRDGDTRRGALSFYTIKPQAGKRLWDARGDGYYQLIPSLSAQGTFRYQSEQNFNSFYAREVPEKVNPDLRSSAALNWTRGKVQLRSFYNDVWGFDHVQGRFRSTDQTLPGYEIVLHPAGILRNSLFFNANMIAQRHRTRASVSQIKAFDRWEDSGNARLACPWNLDFVRWISGSIAGVFSHTYSSKKSAIDFSSGRQSTYGGEAAMRLAPGALLDLNFTYSHILRSEVGSFRQETQANDFGVALRQLSVTESSRLPLNSFLYMQTAYNFPAPCPRTPCPVKLDWTQYLAPVFGSLSMSPFPGNSLAFSTNYQVYVRKYVHNINVSQFLGRISATTNVGYDNNRPNYLLPTFTGTLWVPKIFESVSFTLRTEYLANKQTVLSNHRQTFRYFEREVVVVPALHDFLITLVFRSRPRPDPVREFLFTIRLRTSAQTERKHLEKLNESEFYPWRAQQP